MGKIIKEAGIDNPRAYRVRELTATGRLGKTKIYKLIKEGKLRTVKVGGTRLIPAEELDRLLASGA
jgi:excisionase family DNA binding protein